MHRLRHLILLASLAGCAAQGPPATPSLGSAAPATSSPLTGTWRLTVADEIQPGGVRVHAYGDVPLGSLIVDREGRYSLQIFRAGRRRFASGDKRRGTAEEYSDALLGMSTHTGRCFIDPADGMLVFQIELAAYPNWEGTVQRRSYRLAGDRLSYQIPPSATGNGTIAISEWQRLEP